MAERIHGVIKTYNERGFGFIKPDNEKKDYFFHNSGVICAPIHIGEGVRVTFEPTQGPKGPRAEQVDIEEH